MSLAFTFVLNKRATFSNTGRHTVSQIYSKSVTLKKKIHIIFNFTENK